MIIEVFVGIFGKFLQEKFGELFYYFFWDILIKIENSYKVVNRLYVKR